MIALIEQNRTRIEQLCRQFRVKRLELFGSAAAGGFEEGRSDLDFLVEFFPSDPKQHAHSYLNLLVELENLFGRRIDLLEVKAVQNPYLMESINQNRIELYAA
ncbi:MAG TPA: nucleotidyltransferase domain-containing protein [Anaerohalosphaeraceae bacterium]|nr:nucleotidyltransferase domain-containing protein [Anaerohalosphaeraceae bacterium]HOL89507.1 nucleotidyltransferase domain-containing protein [Anaerohalosphaeraceae bacterium]HPP57103.1 nucleotidyltransferase domain-containing protein [Anaerohalosphaeraceae bacterium]